MYLNDIIADAYRTWQIYSRILIHAPTGIGKTTFIIKTLLLYALENGREILYVSNRTILQQQLIAEVCKVYKIPYESVDTNGIVEFRGITFITYQKLQKLLKNSCFRVPYYYYVIFDEVHYLVEDSSFNPQIQYLLKWMKSMNFGTFIAISATMENVLPYLEKYDPAWQLIHEDNNCEISVRPAKNLLGSLRGEAEYLYYYYVEPEKPQYKLIVYSDIADVVDKINEDITDEKWLVFQSSKNGARSNIVKKLKCTNCLISAEDKENESMASLVEKQKFHEKVLVATKVIDNGVSIHDDNLLNVVMDTTSKTEFLQMLGRRRRSKDCNSEITLFLPLKSKKYFCWLLNTQIVPVINLLNKSEDQLLEALLQSEESRKIIKRFCYFENSRLVVNKAGIINLQNQKRYVEEMISKLEVDEMAFLKEQLGWIGYVDIPYDLINLDIEKMHQSIIAVESLLAGICDKPLSKEEQKLVRENLKVLFARIYPKRFEHEARVIGKHLIEECLGEIDSGYELAVIKGRRKGEESKWIFRSRQI